MKSPLSDAELTEIVQAIERAEQASTGEIVLHIDQSSDGDLAKKAFMLFEEKLMYKTADKNAVLLYVNFAQKYLTIIGDERIHSCVKQTFWNEIHDFLAQNFAKGNYKNALCQAILDIGEELKKYFPLLTTPANSLPNDISRS